MSDGVNASPSPSSVRRQRAAANRERVIAAAADHFGTAGYARTTMERIAGTAGMSVQSLYFTFHTKANLLQAAFDRAALGPDGATPPLRSPWFRAAEQTADGDEALTLVVAGVCEILARTGPLTLTAAAAADSDPAAAEVHARNEDLRMRDQAAMVTALVSKRPLRPGVSLQRATDVFVGLLSPQLHGLLTATRGWPEEDFSGWATSALRRELWDSRT